MLFRSCDVASFGVVAGSPPRPPSGGRATGQAGLIQVFVGFAFLHDDANVIAFLQYADVGRWVAIYQEQIGEIAFLYKAQFIAHAHHLTAQLGHGLQRLRGQQLAREQEPARPALADPLREAHGAAAARDQAVVRVRVAELRLLGLDPDAVEARARVVGRLFKPVAVRGHGWREVMVQDPDGYVWAVGVLATS